MVSYATREMDAHAAARARAADSIARANAVLDAPRPDPWAVREAEASWAQYRADKERQQAQQATADAPPPPAASARPAGGYVRMSVMEAVMKDLGEQARAESFAWQRRVADLERRVAELEGTTEEAEG